MTTKIILPSNKFFIYSMYQNSLLYYIKYFLKTNVVIFDCNMFDFKS